MKKTVITYLLALTLCLTACGGSKPTVDSSESTAASTPATTDESSAAMTLPEEETNSRGAEETDESHLQAVIESMISDLPTDVVEEAGTTTEETSSAPASSGNDFDYAKDFANLTPEARAALDALDTDYAKVYWGVEYSVPTMEGVVVSVTPCFSESEKKLIVAFTNLYGYDITLEAEGTAKDESGNAIGKIHLYETAIGTGQSVIQSVYCSGIPDGRIHWDSFLCKESESDRYAYWESDWTIMGDNDGNMVIPYRITGAQEMQGRHVWALLLDKNGFVLDCYEDYNDSTGTTIDGVIKTYRTDGSGIDDLAFFANPKIAG